MIRSFCGVRPAIAQSAYVDPRAEVIGDVQIGERSTVWPCAVLRGDANSIRIGEDTSIQDNCVLHGDFGELPVSVGSRVTVGHSAVLHGCVIEDDCLIGIGAIVLSGARVGRGSVVAAGALVREGGAVPPNCLVVGMPARVVRAVTDEEKERFQANWRYYVETGQAYRKEQP